MNNLERLISLLSDPTQVTNEEIQTAYGCFMEQLRTASQSEQNYSEVFRMLNDTRIELVSLQTFQRYEQGKNALKNPYLLKAILLLESEIELLKLQIHYSHIGKPEKCSIMKDKIEKIVRELNASIQVGEVELYNIVQNAPAMILMMENAFDELKTLVSEYKFPSFDEEITFFKYTKPILFSKLIYLRKIYYLEIKRPISNFATIRTYLEKEHEQINGFCNKNAEFIQYYRSGQSCFDEYYFLRGRHEMDLNLESFYFERDPKFSTNFDFKVAKLLANDMLAAYLNCELSKLKYQEENCYQVDEELPPAQWTDKKTALGELIYSIHEEKSINAGMIEIKALATIFGRIFKVDLSDIYHIFLEIRGRKTNRTEFLSRLIKALTRRMDDTDSR